MGYKKDIKFEIKCKKCNTASIIGTDDKLEGRIGGYVRINANIDDENYELEITCACGQTVTIIDKLL